MFTDIPKPNVVFTANPPKSVRWGLHKTPCGPMLCGLAEDGSICFLEFVKDQKSAALIKERKRRWSRTVFVEDKRVTQVMVKKIFGKKKVTVRLSGTPFQKKVWLALLDIPASKVVSYAELAQRIKKPKAVRAVGTALGANSVPVVIPCHRVIASDGSLGGFGGGLAVKRLLLKEEGSLLKPRKKRGIKP